MGGNFLNQVGDDICQFFFRIFTDQCLGKTLCQVFKADLFGKADMGFEKIMQTEKDLLHIFNQR